MKRKVARPKASPRGDIIQLILEDHQPLKKSIALLRDVDVELAKRQSVFDEFATALLTHAKAEEAVLYAMLKSDDDLRETGFEGDVEHGLADHLVEDVRRAADEDLWTARAKVLAELVESHLQDEETRLFPVLKKHATAEERVAMGVKYRTLKERFDSSSRARSEEGFAPEDIAPENRHPH